MDYALTVKPLCFMGDVRQAQISTEYHKRRDEVDPGHWVDVAEGDFEDGKDSVECMARYVGPCCVGVTRV